MTMRCLRCAGKGILVIEGQRRMCHRCKGRTVVDGEWEREQRMSEAANARRQVRLISGAVGRLTFWGPTEEDRALVRMKNPEGKFVTVKLKKQDIKEIV